MFLDSLVPSGTDSLHRGGCGVPAASSTPQLLLLSSPGGSTLCMPDSKVQSIICFKGAAAESAAVREFNVRNCKLCSSLVLPSAI